MGSSAVISLAKMSQLAREVIKHQGHEEHRVYKVFYSVFSVSSVFGPLDARVC